MHDEVSVMQTSGSTNLLLRPCSNLADLVLSSGFQTVLRMLQMEELQILLLQQLPLPMRMIYTAELKPVQVLGHFACVTSNTARQYILPYQFAFYSQRNWSFMFRAPCGLCQNLMIISPSRVGSSHEVEKKNGPSAFCLISSFFFAQVFAN